MDTQEQTEQVDQALPLFPLVKEHLGPDETALRETEAYKVCHKVAKLKQDVNLKDRGEWKKENVKKLQKLCKNLEESNITYGLIRRAQNLTIMTGSKLRDPGLEKGSPEAINLCLDYAAFRGMADPQDVFYGPFDTLTKVMGEKPTHQPLAVDKMEKTQLDVASAPLVA